MMLANCSYVHKYATTDCTGAYVDSASGADTCLPSTATSLLDAMEVTCPSSPVTTDLAVITQFADSTCTAAMALGSLIVPMGQCANLYQPPATVNFGVFKAVNDNKNVTFTAYGTADCTGAVAANLVSPVGSCYPNPVQHGTYLYITLGNPFSAANSAVAGLASLLVAAVAVVSTASF